MSANGGGGERRRAGIKSDGTPIRVILIDDEPLLRRTMRILFELDGFQVADFESGEAGLKGLDSFLPDVVLSDVRMPGMDGSEVLTHLRERAPRVAVILLSGYVDPDFESDMLARGAYAVLSKTGSAPWLEAQIRAAAGEAA